MTTSSGYFRPAAKSGGLCRTPSIVAPSWLFHDTTSRVVAVHADVCAFMSVSLRADFKLEGPTKTSAIDFESAPRKAIAEPSRDSEKPDPIHSSAGARRSIALLDGSSRYK